MSASPFLRQALEVLFPTYAFMTESHRSKFERSLERKVCPGEALSLQSVLVFIGIDAVITTNESGGPRIRSILRFTTPPVTGDGEPLVEPKREGGSRLPPDIRKINIQFKKEERKTNNKKRLRQFLRTGIRSSTTYSDTEGLPPMTLREVAESRGIKTSPSWAHLGPIKRTRAYVRYLNENPRAEPSDEEASVRQVREALESGDTRLLMRLPEPQYDARNGTIVAIRKKGGVAQRPDVRRSTKKAGGMKKFRKQCQAIRKTHRDNAKRSVKFYGNFVANNK